MFLQWCVSVCTCKFCKIHANLLAFARIYHMYSNSFLPYGLFPKKNEERENKKINVKLPYCMPYTAHQKYEYIARPEFNWSLYGLFCNPVKREMHRHLYSRNAVHFTICTSTSTLEIVK